MTFRFTVYEGYCPQHDLFRGAFDTAIKMVGRCPGCGKRYLLQVMGKALAGTPWRLVALDFSTFSFKGYAAKKGTAWTKQRARRARRAVRSKG